MEKIKTWAERIIKILFVVFVLYFLWGIYLADAGYDVEKNHIIHAWLYENEEKIEPVTIEVNGTYRESFFGNDYYQGVFSVSLYPETQKEANAHISWRKEYFNGKAYPYNVIRYYYYNPEKPYKNHQHINTNAPYTIDVLNKEMTEILWLSYDGRCIATEAAYEAWQAEQTE